MKYQGYTGTVLRVDLKRRQVESMPLAEKLAEDYIGGVGIAAALIDESLIADLDPLDERNPLVFMTGPLTGTQVPWSGRHCVATISPLTGIWGEAYAGGTWGRELKRAGFDGIVVTGKAERPVYLKITDQTVTIEDAGSIAGKDALETEQLLRNCCGEKVKVAAIGIAGEKLVKFAAVIHDGPAARTAARCGVGAVMGSKNLKAIAVLGNQSVAVAEKEKLQQSIRAALPEMVKKPEHCLKKALAVFTMFVNDGRPGVNNWRDGYLAGFNESVLKEIENHTRKAQPYQCAGCPTGCVESNVKAGVRQNVWESIAPLGSQCGMTDMSFVQKAYDLCNRHGIDTISAGGVISFAMECFEEGLISEKDTDGLHLTFGSGDAMLAMLGKICRREGFGAVLAEGTRRAAQMIGKGAEKYAIEVKGLEVPAHDPRAHNFLALAYATDPRGAIHTGAADPKVEGFDLMDMAAIRFNADIAPEMVARGQDYGGILNSLVLCAFSHAGYAQCYSAQGFPGITAKEVTEWLNLATGMEKDFSSLMLSGEKIFNLKHQINLKRGLDSSSDYLHERFTTLKRNYGPAADHLPPVEKMIKDYYHIRGWEDDGRITPQKLIALGLNSTPI
jgi:aldehyde:ferredoxin oxidoreductase